MRARCNSEERVGGAGVRVDWGDHYCDMDIPATLLGHLKSFIIIIISMATSILNYTLKSCDGF